MLFDARQGTPHPGLSFYGTRRRILNRDTLLAALLWLALTAALEVLALNVELFPMGASEEAEVVDKAFRLLTYLAAPVFAFVISVVVFSALRFRRKGEPSEDGPPVHVKHWIVFAWLVVTAGLTIFMIINPGIIGLNDIRANAGEPPELLVKVQAGRWFWRMTYPEQGIVSSTELVLPVDKRVRFEVTSLDVLHSFWIPAFRMKIDALPDRITTFTTRPNTVGLFDDDVGFRVQCAELCGLGHAAMRMPVRVVEQDEFDAWVADNS